jgi:hypothetical protein
LVFAGLGLGDAVQAHGSRGSEEQLVVVRRQVSIDKGRTWLVRKVRRRPMHSINVEEDRITSLTIDRNCLIKVPHFRVERQMRGSIDVLDISGLLIQS